ncbi:MAG: class I SAM-dependent methyltransferase [Phenylobacterium sp.]|nr:class I SAM-dependent methyltransferase [Phenylobacterium sp.]
MENRHPASAHSGFIKPARRYVRRFMEITGLIGPYFRWLEHRIARRPGEPVIDGRPMPPRDLIVAVSGTADERWFSERGKSDAAKFMTIAKRYGLDEANVAAVLDWGCGCGRIARWIADDVIRGGGRFHGADLNPTLIRWCAANLPGVYTENGLRPPLPLGDSQFDLVYAHSVLTHLTEAVAVDWLAECARVLKPGAIALLTFHDETFAEHWGPPEVSPALKTRPYLVWNNALEGSNYLSAWTTRAHFGALARTADLDLLEIIPGSQEFPEQALAVLRRR